MRRAALAAAVVVLGALGACDGGAVTVAPVGDYTGWKRVDTYGLVPGHGDSYRMIYVNDIARQFAGGQYAEGTILVKEVHERIGDQPGALQVTEIMRRIGPAPSSLEDQAGWLFTLMPPGGIEAEKTTCWRRCHAQAPFAGAWMNYGDQP